MYIAGKKRGLQAEEAPTSTYHIHTQKQILAHGLQPVTAARLMRGQSLVLLRKGREQVSQESVHTGCPRNG